MFLCRPIRTAARSPRADPIQVKDIAHVATVLAPTTVTQIDGTPSATVTATLATLAAIALVFLIMVATFRSLLQPLILLVSIPFAATGAVVGLLVTDTPLGVPSMIGLLMLIGIVVTNAIVLIDLINQYRSRGEALQGRGGGRCPAPAGS